jgi:hypothetical protein
MEKRRSKRYLKAISVRFGTHECQHIGLTYDLSQSGLLLKSSRIFPPLTKLILELSPSSQGKIYCEGYVQWAKQGPTALVHAIKKLGMGVFLINTPAEYNQIIDQLGHHTEQRLSGSALVPAKLG